MHICIHNAIETHILSRNTFFTQRTPQTHTHAHTHTDRQTDTHTHTHVDQIHYNHPPPMFSLLSCLPLQVSGVSQDGSSSLYQTMCSRPSTFNDWGTPPCWLLFHVALSLSRRTERQSTH